MANRPNQIVANKPNLLQKPNSVSKPIQKPVVPATNPKSLFKPNTISMNGVANGIIPIYK